MRGEFEGGVDCDSVCCACGVVCLCLRGGATCVYLCRVCAFVCLSVMCE
jgi:hypothetical protein